METGPFPRINTACCDSIVLILEEVAFSVLHAKVFRF